MASIKNKIARSKDSRARMKVHNGLYRDAPNELEKRRKAKWKKVVEKANSPEAVRERELRESVRQHLDAERKKREKLAASPK